MSYTRTCVDCDATISYKRKNSYQRSCRNTPEPRCRSCKVKKAWRSSSYRDKRAESVRKTWADPARREAAARKTAERWKDPEQRAHMTQCNRDKWTEAERERQSKAQKALWQDPNSRFNQPEFRQLRSEIGIRRFMKLGAAATQPKQRHELTTYEKRKWSNQVKERDDWTCQECGSQEQLHAHHVKERFMHPELVDDVDNGITLCELCHAKKHPYVTWMKDILARAKEGELRYNTITTEEE